MPTVWRDLANSRNTRNISNLKEVIWNALICTVNVVLLYMETVETVVFRHGCTASCLTIAPLATNHHAKNKSTQSKIRIMHTYAIGNELSCYSRVSCRIQFPPGRHQTYFRSIRGLPAISRGFLLFSPSVACTAGHRAVHQINTRWARVNRTTDSYFGAHL